MAFNVEKRVVHGLLFLFLHLTPCFPDLTVCDSLWGYPKRHTHSSNNGENLKRTIDAEPLLILHIILLKAYNTLAERCYQCFAVDESNSNKLGRVLSFLLGSYLVF